MESLYKTNDNSEVCSAVTLADTEALIRLFEQVAAEEGWSAGGQLRAFLQNAVYFSLYVGGTLAGGLQLVRPSTSGKLPGHAVWPELPDPDPQSAHIVILALKREYRGCPERFWLLCAEMWRYCFRQRITHLYLEVTPATLKVYRRLGWPLEVIGEPRVHWGEDCVPARFDLCAAAGEVVRRAESSPLYRRIAAQLFRASGQG